MAPEEKPERYDPAKDPDFDPELYITTLDDPAPSELDMTGEPLRKKVWYKIIGLT